MENPPTEPVVSEPTVTPAPVENPVASAEPVPASVPSVASRRSPLLFILGGIGGLIILVLVVLFAYTYQVSGKITDIAENKPVKGATVKIAGHTTQTNDQGEYSLKGIKLYEKKALVLTLPDGYQKQDDTKLAYTSRIITNNVAVVPTAARVAAIVAEADKNGQYDIIWNYMHPDEQAFWTNKAGFVETMSDFNAVQNELGVTLKTSKVSGEARTLPTWKSALSDKVYSDVVEVPIETVTVSDGIEKPVTYLYHFQNTQGYFRIITDIDGGAIEDYLNEVAADDSSGTTEADQEALLEEYNSLNQI
jgi:hypothetical protein